MKPASQESLNMELKMTKLVRYNGVVMSYKEYLIYVGAV